MTVDIAADSIANPGSPLASIYTRDLNLWYAKFQALRDFTQLSEDTPLDFIPRPGDSPEHRSVLAAEEACAGRGGWGAGGGGTRRGALPLLPGAAGATEGIDSLNAFFLLVDRPEVYNLPAAPSLPSRRIGAAPAGSRSASSR